jgi:hypothetical protein
MLRKWLRQVLRLVPENERRHWYSAEGEFVGSNATAEAADQLALDLWQFILSNPDWIRNAQLTAVTVGSDKSVTIFCDIWARSKWSANDELQDLLLTAWFWDEMS